MDHNRYNELKGMVKEAVYAEFSKEAGVSDISRYGRNFIAMHQSPENVTNIGLKMSQHIVGKNGMKAMAQDALSAYKDTSRNDTAKVTAELVSKALSRKSDRGYNMASKSAVDKLSKIRSMSGFIKASKNGPDAFSKLRGERLTGLELGRRGVL